MIAFNNKQSHQICHSKMKTMLNKIKQFFNIECSHRFTIEDVVKFKDPECVYCKKKLSDCKK